MPSNISAGKLKSSRRNCIIDGIVNAIQHHADRRLRAVLTEANLRLTALKLKNFRSYENITLTPPEGITVIAGENGTGKTNLLEAVHLCCLGRSHRTNTDTDMILSGAETAAVQLTVQRNDGRHDTGVRLFRSQKRKKICYVNGKTAQRVGDLMGHATCVIFSPEDLGLVQDGPNVRRRYLDMLLSQLQPAYFFTLQQYTAALRERNALLKLPESPQLSSQLDIWDEQLAQAAAPLIRLRSQMSERLSQMAAGHYRAISGRDEEMLGIRYQTQLTEADLAAQAVSMLRAHRQDDFRRQTTSVGPHRDDLHLTLSGVSLQAYASQGQARTAALSMKLAAFDLLCEEQGEPPLLLLDDVLSELDPQRRHRLIARIRGAQALLTCTDVTDLNGAEPNCVLHVRDGTVTE